jgi:transposase
MGLLPLLSMTEGGAEPELMQEMTSTLQDAGEIELLALAFAFGGMVDGGRAYKEWFIRRFSMLDDILEESWTYQHILRKGVEQERQRRIQEQRETVVSFVQMRFPELVPLAEQHLHFVHDPEELHNLILKLFAVQTVDEARRAITETDKD